ncbi:hypothetical protein EV204_10651 [Tissierella praeacuta]|uniref:hypothetical protein n=1 Tax=Tissierella praeacuta TaxID=43131 RepID=UPI001047FC44|nr:hypothetical protein [Tissierella praeacuta]TCU71589.1 hypothetical protein EV204_10651 [Tissierella praeacuta]
MIIGIYSIFIGVVAYIQENYNIDIVDEERNFINKKYIQKDKNYRYNALDNVFFLSLGMFRILSGIIY